MRGLKDYYIVLFRARPTLVGLMLLVFFGVFIISCDEVEHYKTLTFFFDGVPRVGGEVPAQEFAKMRPKAVGYIQEQPKTVEHGSRKDCDFCHERLWEAGRAEFVKLLPELCYHCHTDYTVSAAFVHGPVAVGDCLFCHNLHKSKIGHLLKEPEPKLCYKCHNINTIELIPAHFTNQQFTCTGCHYAHASSAEYLLKGATSQTNDELDKAKAISKAVRTTELESKSLLQVFGTVSKLVERGEMQKARAYLEKFKDSNAFTDEERRKIVHVLRLMDIAATRTGEHLGKVKQGSSITEWKPQEQPAVPEKSNNQLSKHKKDIAELYYRSITFYHAGQLEKAREGLVKVLKSGLIPAAMAKTIRGYLLDIDDTLAKKATPPNGGR